MFCYVAGEMALQVRALADLAEEPRSVLSTHSIYPWAEKWYSWSSQWPNSI